jgi:HEPN domain-containing protein/predicted nucleotidyltransferase
MKTGLDHLPDYKQSDLLFAVEIIREVAEPDLLILFGSYARGDWVEEKDPDLPFYRYQSDFDLLAVTRNEALAQKIERKDSLHRRLMHQVRTPVSLIAEDIRHVNHQLSKARYFYVDIVRQGILLHDSGALKLGEPKELTPAERWQYAGEDYEHWSHKARSMFDLHLVCIERGELNDAAFTLHQAAERTYAAILLVFTHYKPKTHDLAKLREMAASVDPEFVKIFPLGTPEEKRLFELLRKAYVDARYERSYTITIEELSWLGERVRYLRQVAESACRAKIEELGRMV